MSLAHVGAQIEHYAHVVGSGVRDVGVGDVANVVAVEVALVVDIQVVCN